MVERSLSMRQVVRSMLTTSTYKNEHRWVREVGCLSLLFFVRLCHTCRVERESGPEAFLGTAHGVVVLAVAPLTKMEGAKLRQFLLLSLFFFFCHDLYFLNGVSSQIIDDKRQQTTNKRPTQLASRRL